MILAVAEIDGEANQQPHDKPEHRFQRQAANEIKTRQNACDWNKRHAGTPKRTQQVRLRLAQVQDARAD